MFSPLSCYLNSPFFVCSYTWCNSQSALTHMHSWPAQHCSAVAVPDSIELLATPKTGKEMECETLVHAHPLVSKRAAGFTLRIISSINQAVNLLQSWASYEYMQIDRLVAIRGTAVFGRYLLDSFFSPGGRCLLFHHLGETVKWAWTTCLWCLIIFFSLSLFFLK